MARNTCVITGASRGIGLAIAERFTRDGWNLVIAARNGDALRTAATRIESLGAACEAVAADVGTSDGATRLIDTAVVRFGGVHALVNNVGDALLGPIAEITDERFEQAMRANVSSVFYAARSAWPVMQRQRSGTIVSISSMASADPFPGFAVYGGCKAWVNVFTKAMAEEGRPLGIRVFAVAPGAVETDMLRGAFPDFPADRTLAPADVADVVFSLCQDEMRHATGQTIFIRK